LGSPSAMGIKGNRVQIPDGPATVSGERLPRCHWVDKTPRKAGDALLTTSQETCLVNLSAAFHGKAGLFVSVNKVYTFEKPGFLMDKAGFFMWLPSLFCWRPLHLFGGIARMSFLSGYLFKMQNFVCHVIRRHGNPRRSGYKTGSFIYSGWGLLFNEITFAQGRFCPWGTWF